MDTKTVAIIAVAASAGIVAVGTAAAIALRTDPEPHGVPIAHAEPSPTPTTRATPPRVPTITDQKTLADAIRFAGSAGQQRTSEHSDATAAVAVWAIYRMRWSDVSVAEDETSYGLAQKSIDSARGKRLCISGTVIQISEDKFDGGIVVAEGLMQSAAGNLFSFNGVGSSGKIIESSWARFCGVVVDKYDYSNSGGGVGHAIEVVGMFDLPENRTRPAPELTER